MLQASIADQIERLMEVESLQQVSDVCENQLFLTVGEAPNGGIVRGGGERAAKGVLLRGVPSHGDPRDALLDREVHHVGGCSGAIAKVNNATASVSCVPLGATYCLPFPLGVPLGRVVGCSAAGVADPG